MRLFKFFDYNEFIEELKECDYKKETVEKYSRYYGPQENVSIYETAFYKDYLSKFDIPFQLVVSEDLEDELDMAQRDLLTRLMVGSFSSNYDLVLDENSQQEIPRVHLYITVSNDDSKECVDIADLWSFQILRLYEIYTSEQMNLFSLKKEDDGMEEAAVSAEQRMRLRKFKRKVAPIVNQHSLNKELISLVLNNGTKDLMLSQNIKNN